MSDSSFSNMSPSERAAIRKIQIQLGALFWIVAQAALFCGAFMTAGASAPAMLFLQANGILSFVLVSLLLGGFCFFLAVYAVRPLARRLSLISRFTQDTGHELSTPVAIIRSRLQLFERELEQSGGASEHLPVLLRAMVRVDNLIQDLRVLARAENPDCNLDLSLVRLHQTVRNSLAELNVEFAEKSITTQVELVSVSIIGDEQALHRMLINLLTNALRYGKIGGQVSVSLRKKGNDVVLTIADDGGGIPEENLPFIFERFYRVDSSRSRKTGGSGLGLAIVKAIVDSHKGSINVESSGAGTSFIITLPPVPQHPALLFLGKRGD